MVGPTAFQKSITIIPEDRTYNLDPDQGKNSLRVDEFIGTIPYQENPRMIWDVVPQEKYKKAILEGGGNCSNLVFGASYYLLSHDIKFFIIHLFSKDHFLSGVGHTVLGVDYTRQGARMLGLVDILEGGLPLNRLNKALSVDDFIGESLDFDGGKRQEKNQLISLSILKDDTVNYLTNEYMDSVVVGVIPSQDVNVYFTFIDSLYFPLGNKRIEKMFFDWAAAVAGVLPRASVSRRNFVILFDDDNYHTYLVSHVALWLFRLGVFLCFLCFVSFLIKSTRYAVDKLT